LCQLLPECLGVDEVDELAPAVDFHDRDPLAVPLLESRVSVDYDLLELEPELVPKRADGRPRLLAEVAVRGVVETDYG
jgi:hypothetical protein